MGLRPIVQVRDRVQRQFAKRVCFSVMPCTRTLDLSPIDDLEDHGDLVPPNTTLQAMRGALEPQVESMLAHQHMVWLGAIIR